MNTSKTSTSKKKVLIIGSGMSGLTAGAYLSLNGYKVDLYEQFSHIGGVTATISQNGYSWDLGPMLVEGLSSHEKLGQIFQELGINIEDKLTLIRDERGQSFLSYDLNPPEEYEGSDWRKERLKEIYPNESKGLNRYYEIHDTIMKLMYSANQIPFQKGVRALITNLKLFFTFLKVRKYKDWSAQQLMDHLFTDEELKTVFLGILADMTVKPSEFSALGVPIFNPEAIYDKRIPIHNKKKGFKYPTYYYIKNGCGEMVKVFADFIKNHGGKIHTNSKITKILVENGGCKGVELENGEHIEADVVLASGGLQNTFYNLVGKENLTTDLVNYIDNIQYMESVLMVHVGTSMDFEKYQDKPLFYYYRTDDIEGVLDKMRQGINHGGKDGFLIYNLSMHSPEMAPPGKHAVTIYTVVPHKLKNGDWTEQREQLADQLLMEAEKILPGLYESIDTKVILTPDDFKKRLNVVQHSFGGICPTMSQKNPPYETPVENLYYIGQFSESGAGVFGTAMGGREVAIKILKGKKHKSTKSERGETAHGF
jgi:phytoene dehydrogenase-like protein